MNFMTHLPVLIVIIPLSAALLSIFLSKFCRPLGKILVILSLAAALICAGLQLWQVAQIPDHTIHYAVGNWEAPIGIEFVIDPLNAMLSLAITFIAFCAAIYSHSFLYDKSWLQSGAFFTLLALLDVGLNGMVLTGDVFNLYVFLEISSLSCYGLVALGGKRSVLAAFRYLLVGTIGASLYLIAIGFLYSMTGTLNMADLSVLIQPYINSGAMIIVIGCLIAAFGIKMAIFPFHVWQPDAYSYAHPGASPLISGAMSKVPAFAMLRFFFFIFGIQNWMVGEAMQILAIIGAIGMIYGSALAMAQNDFRRMLAFSSVAQLGYVALGIGLGGFYGITGAFMHILVHLLMKGGLFFAIGGIQYKYGIVDIRRFGRIYRKMPLTCFTIVVCALSMIGIPPTGGFFSKWYLLLATMDKHAYIYIAVLIVSSLMNAVYFLRLLENIFISKPLNPPSIKGKSPKGLELPLNMLLPIVIFGILVIVIGFASSNIVTNIISTALQGVAL